MMKLDLHLHSKYSWDSSVSIENYILKAEELEFTAISITDHNDIRSHEEIRRLQKTTNVKLIPGQEVSTLDGHLLIYGWLDQVPEGLTMKKTVEIAKKQEGICVAAHPFDPFRNGTGKRIFESDIDGFEVLNASSWFNFPNKRASKIYKKTSPGLIGFGNSDSHKIDEFGAGYTQSPMFQFDTYLELFQNLKNCEVQGNRIGFKRKFTRYFDRKFS